MPSSRFCIWTMCGHRHVVDVLQDVGHQPGGEDLGHRLHHLVEVGERSEHGGAVFQARKQLDSHLGDQRQGAFGADDELGQVVAGGHLGDLAAGPDDLAGRQHRLQPEHVIAGHPVLDRTHSAGVGSDVAADAGGQLARVNRVLQAGADGRGVQVGQRHPGLDDGDLVGTSTSRTAFIRSKEISSPSARGRAAPDKPLPDPRAVTGTWCSAAATSSWATSSARRRLGDVRRPLRR